MKSLTIQLTDDEMAQLATMAQHQRRRPADQAAHIISIQVEQYTVFEKLEPLWPESQTALPAASEAITYPAPEGKVIDIDNGAIPFEQRVANRIVYMATSLGISPEELTVTLGYSSSDGKQVEVNASAAEV